MGAKYLKSARSEPDPQQVSTGARVLVWVVAVLAAVTAVYLTLRYAAWADHHNALYYAAAEVAKEPVYEPGHCATGWTLGAALAAVTVVLLLCTVVGIWGRVTWGMRVTVLGVLAAVAVAVILPAWLLSPVFGYPPLFAAVALIVFTARAARPEHTRHSR